MKHNETFETRVVLRCSDLFMVLAPLGLAISSSVCSESNSILRLYLQQVPICNQPQPFQETLLQKMWTTTSPSYRYVVYTI